MVDPRTASAEARPKLVRLLQLAHGGEAGAALAYESHARNSRTRAERDEILKIRDEEIDHRARVGAMLSRLGEAPDPRVERVMTRIGRAIASFCRIGGWFLPMYGAGLLERRNIVEYEDAARAAALSGHPELVDDLLDMAGVEWDHERYFRLKSASHWAWRWMPQWEPTTPREQIRVSFDRFESERRATGSSHRITSLDAPPTRPSRIAALPRSG